MNLMPDTQCPTLDNKQLLWPPSMTTDHHGEADLRSKTHLPELLVTPTHSNSNNEKLWCLQSALGLVLQLGIFAGLEIKKTQSMYQSSNS
jgi:hypothetical protein